MTAPACHADRAREVVVGLALTADVLNRDLLRAAREAGGPWALWKEGPSGLARRLRLDGAQASHAAGMRRAETLKAAAARLAADGVRVLPSAAPGLPPRLGEIYDPPVGLFVRGDWDRVADGLAEAPVVAIVGSRRPSPPGERFAAELAGQLAARGAVVVSGLAVGIDAAAHEGALGAGGLTVAVLGCGLARRYPRANRDLRARIERGGAVMSEYWVDTPPAPWRFPARNRIVAGLSHAVVVVEAAERSGALITADFALEAGRPVLAVPGSPWSEPAQGCNTLIRAGAALCCGADDVVAELPGLAWADTAGAATQPPVGLAAEVVALLTQAPRRADELATALDRDPASIAATLASLEMDGHALRGEGQRYWATPRA